VAETDQNGIEDVRGHL